LQAAFGRQGCAEQSVVQDTLDACTAANVEQMHHAIEAIYRRHSRGYRHDYAQGLAGVDADMSGMPCGKKAAFATKGYFCHQRIVADGSWGGYWPRGMTKSSSIASLGTRN